MIEYNNGTCELRKQLRLLNFTRAQHFIRTLDKAFAKKIEFDDRELVSALCNAFGDSPALHGDMEQIVRAAVHTLIGDETKQEIENKRPSEDNGK